MKKFWKMAAGLILLAFLVACEKDEIDINPPGGNPSPVLVKFDEDFVLAENSAAEEISVHFDKAAFKGGSLKIKVSTDFPMAFQTVPASVDGILEIPVAKGAPAAFFTIAPEDNTVLDEERTVTFELEAASEGFTIGTPKSIVVTILDDEGPAEANFSTNKGILRENESEGIGVEILLSAPAPLAGKLFIQLSDDREDGVFVTEPALSTSGLLELAVPAGATSVSFRLIPKDNALLKGHRSAVFSIASTEGGILKGTQSSYEVTVLDDELLFKPKSYETMGGSWRTKKTYEYDTAGRIARIQWETETPFLRSGTDVFYYSENNHLERINRGPNYDEFFYQENGRIVRSEVIENSIKKSYSLYDYDPAGNVGAEALYYRQPSGEYKLSTINVYLYYNSGNIYKQLIYIPQEHTGEDLLISTRTFDDYSSYANPFPMIEVIPNVGGQPNLPGSFRLEEHGMDLLYNFTYEFLQDGRPVKRYTSSGPSVSEVTTYDYY